MSEEHSSSCLLVAKSLWGVSAAGDPARWDALFARLREEGYVAVETICVFDLNQDPILFCELLDKYSLKLIIQLHTASDWSIYDYCTSCDVDDHVVLISHFASLHFTSPHFTSLPSFLPTFSGKLSQARAGRASARTRHHKRALWPRLLGLGHCI